MLCLRQPTKHNLSFEKTHQVSNLTDTLTEEPTDDIDVSSFSWHICRVFKGSPDQSHFIFEIIVGNWRNRHRTTPKLNDEFLHRPKIE